MWYVYTVLAPVGVGMGAFHIIFMIQRLGPKPGEGDVIADGTTILCCALGQSVWLAIWASWVSGIQSTCGDLAAAAPLALGLSCVGSLIIVGTNVVRLVLYFQSGGNCRRFAASYTGGDFED